MRSWITGLFLSALALATQAAQPASATLKIEHWKTEGGIRIYFARAPQLPIVDMRLVFDAGSARDGKLPGLARATAALLDEGSGSWDADDIAIRFEDVGAQYDSNVERDQASMSLRSLSDSSSLEPALETFIKVVTAPSFPQSAFTRIKKQMLVGLREEAQSPETIADKAFYRAVYRDHPFASPMSGTEDSVRAIEPQDVRAFHERFFVTGNAVLALVGDLTRAQAEAIAARIDKAMPQGKAPPPLPAVEPLEQARTINIPFPSEQAHVFIGQTGIPRGDPNYFPLYVGNHVLGGSGFTSRLVKEVRVQRGLSYSVYSYFLPELVAGPFVIGLQTRIDQAAEAAQVARDTVGSFVQDGPTQQELALAISNITGGFPLRIDSNQDILEYTATIGYYRLPLDYLDTFNDKVKAVGRAKIRAAFRDQLAVQRMVQVIVGGEQKG
jgi:zinc protease